MNLFPIAVWGVMSIIGYFIYGVEGAIVGLGIGMTLSILASLKD